jgi:hypothetical protein
MRLSFLAAFCALGGMMSLAAPAAGQQPSQTQQTLQTEQAPLNPQRPQVVTQFTDPIVQRLLLDLQSTWQVEPNPEAEPNYRAVSSTGISYTVSPRSCSEERGCSALLVLSVFTGVDTSDLLALDGFLHRINDRLPTAKVYRADGSIIILQTWINAAGGITYRNAQAQMLIFGRDVDEVRRALAAFQATMEEGAG